MNAFGAPRPGITQLDIVRQVRRLQSKSPFTSDDVIAVAQRIYGWLPVNGSFEDSLSHYVRAMNGVAYAALQEERLYVATSGLSAALTWLFTLNLPYESDASAILRRNADDYTRAAAAHYDPAASMHYMRSAEHLARLNGAYSRRLQMVDVVQERIPYSEEWNVFGAASELVEYATYVAYKIGECRRYGVKPCIMQDGIMHLPDDVWVFLDGFDELGKLPAEYQEGLRLPLAITHLAGQKDVKSLESQVSRQGHAAALSPSYDRSMAVSVQLDGTLTIDSEMGLYPLQRIFEEAGRSEVFEMFRLVHLMRLSDLIVPEIVRRQYQAPHWPTQPRNKSAQRAYRQALSGQLRELIIPRVRLLDDVEMITRAQEGELIEDMTFTDQLQEQRTLGPMVGHFRRLPRGHKASPQACTLALEERGMFPPEGMTYVAGREGGKVIHIAKRR